MRTLILKLTLVASIFFVLSCSNDSIETEEDLLQESLTNIVPVPLDQLQRENVSKILPYNQKANGTPTWENKPGDDSFFYRENNQVFEERNGKIIFTFSIWIDNNGSFLYITDTSRNFHIALPIWNPGSYSTSWIWSNSENKWKEWRQFKFMSGTPCDNDTEAPTMSTSIRICQDGKDAPLYECSMSRVRVKNFPYILPDDLEFLKDIYNFTDNCDDNLTTIQYPPPGTVFNGPTTMLMDYKVIDNNGNTLRFFKLRSVEKW